MVKTLGIEQFAPMNHIYRFYELNDYMKSIAEIGYHSMDLWTCGSHYFVDSNNYEDTKYIKKLMSQYDIRIVSITPRQSCPNPFHMAVKKTELREKAKQYFQNMILAAHELSCPKLLITSGWQSYSETRQEAWDRSVWMVGELCRFAEKYGVSLTMETLSRQSTTLVNTISDLKQMMKEVNSKAFTITADIHTIDRIEEMLNSEAIHNKYDYVICDCGLLLDVTVLNVVKASELLIIPVKAGGYGIEAIENMIEQAKGIHEGQQIRILMTMKTGNQTNKDTAKWLRDTYKEKMFQTEIRRSVVAEKAETAFRPLSEMSKSSNAAKDYNNVIDQRDYDGRRVERSPRVH